MNYAVIMAGGTGKRLWPLSRKNRPKQVLKLLDGKTLLRCCFDRLTPIFDVNKIIVLTNAAYVDTVRQNLAELPAENVIAEPAVRDTASAIGLAASVIAKKSPQAAMAVVTADHLIEPAEALQQALADALGFVKNSPDSLVTFGIKPTFASTQLGYIKCINPQKQQGCINNIYKVDCFKEKPDQDTAAGYLNEGDFFWNSGMFVWKAQTILDNLKKFVPASAEPLQKIQDAWNTPDQQAELAKWFVTLPKISIDYAVMEKSDRVHAIELDCRWLDLGSFNALADILKPDENQNFITGAESQFIDSKNNIIATEHKGHLIAAIGVEDLVIAHTPDATLICRSDQTHRLKELLEMIEKDKGEKYL